MKRLLKQKNGMTLMEILVALTLLMIVIVGTTPVMLSAFDGLYTAGEFTQDTYEAKSEVEEKLATRNTKDIYNPGFQVNFKNIGEVANINARRAVSSLKGSVETLFTNGKVHVSIVSAKEISDDYSEKEYSTVNGSGWHELILQTTNLDFGTTDPATAAKHLSVNAKDGVDPDVADDDPNKKYVDITLLLPKRDAKGEANIYNPNNGDDYLVCNNDYKTNIKDIVVEPITGRITMKIRGFDFTQSPIKIDVTYLDENDDIKNTYTYLKVKQPTIIAVGETGSSDYYTSPGVVVKSITYKDSTGKVTKREETSFGFYGRDMTLKTFDNADVSYEFYGAHPRIKSGVYSIPSNTVIKSINWITEDEATGIDPYYVLTGTNGAIYRTYSFNGANDTLKTTVGLKDENKLGKDYKEFFLKDQGATTAYPAFWGGDKSHQFGYSTYLHAMGYNVDDDDNEDMCWYTGLKDPVNGSFENSKADAYSTKAKFAYYYNGHTTSYNYATQNSRKISYILTEVGNAMKRGGMMNVMEDFEEFYNKIWEDYSDNPDGGAARNDPNVWFYKNESGKIFQQSPLYFTAANTNSNSGLEEGFAQIRIKYLTTNSPYSMATEKRDSGGSRDFSSNMWLNDDMYSSDVTITDAVYIPKTTADGITTGGEMFYVGTVSANALLNQTDGMYPAANQSSWDEKTTNDWRYAGWRTAYAVFGDSTNGTTAIHKLSLATHVDEGDNLHHSSQDSYQWFFEETTSPLKPTSTTYDVQSTEEVTTVNSPVAHEFFVNRSTVVNYSKDKEKFTVHLTSCLFKDLQFTMGFASDRAVAYSQNAFGMVNGVKKEAFKGCESFYFSSHYEGNSNHVPNLFMTTANTNYMGFLTDKTKENEDFFNSYHNDYYNVWFPGEMYNLTKVATEDGVTVSVGYAVAGSVYQFVNPNQDTNTSTALGGIYNDGVLSAMIGGVDPTLTNLLYYKDNDSFDDYSLTSGDLSYDYNDYNGDSYVRYTNFKKGGLFSDDKWDYDTVGKSDYNLFDSEGYGTHTRNSIQFTAVDIGVQRVVSNSNEQATYYAYYADNKGRVFRSKIAEKSSTIGSNYDPEKPNENVTVNSLKKVDYISDKVYSYGNIPKSGDADYKANVGYMEQLSCHPTKNFEWLYSKITSIKVEGNYVIIAGHPNQDNADTIKQLGIPIVVGKINETTGAITKWNIACLETSNATKYNIEDMFVRDGRIYVAGTCESLSASKPGFVATLNLVDVEKNLTKISENDISKTETSKYSLMAVQVPDKLYAIAGQ